MLKEESKLESDEVVQHRTLIGEFFLMILVYFSDTYDQKDSDQDYFNSILN